MTALEKMFKELDEADKRVAAVVKEREKYQKDEVVCISPMWLLRWNRHLLKMDVEAIKGTIDYTIIQLKELTPQAADNYNAAIRIPQLIKYKEQKEKEYIEKAKLLAEVEVSIHQREHKKEARRAKKAI